MRSILIDRILMLVLLFSAVILNAQSETISTDTLDPEQVHILHADDIFFEQTKEGLEQRLVGNVALYQDSTFFYCDSAIIIDNQVWAKGNIQILQGDSTRIFSDSLFYSGDDRQADLYGEVSLYNRENTLFTSVLSYDLDERVASYTSRAVLARGSTKITSRRGSYLLNERLAVFADSVVVIDTNFVLKADTLNFDTESQIALFQGPTSIEREGNLMYCEDGFYNLKTGNAEFIGKASFVKEEQRGRADRFRYNDSLGIITLIGNALILENDRRVTGDSIVYFQKEEKGEIHGDGHFEDSTRVIDAGEIYFNEKNKSLITRSGASFAEGDIILDANILEYDDESGQGRAQGQVIWRDTANDVAIFCDLLNYNKKSEYVEALGERPYMAVILDSDTMFVSGDTLISEKLPTADTLSSDSIRRIRIFHNVKIFKSDMQGLCDSLVYSERDSAFTLIRDPFIWSDTSQFSSDTIRVYLKDKTVDHVHQIGNSLIVNSTDLIYFNQIQGKQIWTFMQEGKPHQTIVEGNAQTIYFALDDEDAYIAANKSICSKIRIAFKERKIDDITFLAQPKAEMLPMNTAGLKDIRLEGYVWNYDNRPESKDEVIGKK